MPESKVRKAAEQKKKHKQKREADEERQEKVRLAPDNRKWVPWAFSIVGLLGVAWMIVYNLAGSYIGFMAMLGGWNILIAIGLIICAFGLATLWK